MRPIKFRGKRIENDQWVIGSLIYRGDSINPVMNIDRNIGPVDVVVDAATVGQFTGLLDRNGKEIYEGDLLFSPLSEVNPFGMVAWHPNGYFFIDMEFGKRMPAEDFRTLGEMMKYMIGGRSTEFEVVGNIHDNPELLKGGK